MVEKTWIQLQCPRCGEDWEAHPDELPPPGRDFVCNHCGVTRSISEFTQTQRDFEILERIHES